MEMTYRFLAILLLASVCLSEFGALAQDEDRLIVCPRAVSRDMDMRLQASDPNKVDFHEVSGLGFSSKRLGPSGYPLFYVVNDSGSGRRFGIYDSATGERLKSLRMPRSLDWALDYESITVGSCGVDDGDCIYIADVGDNASRHTNGRETAHPEREGAHPIYKIREPNIDDFEDNGILPESDVTTLWFNYLHPTSPTQYADSEATFLDHVGWGGGSPGDYYIVTKWDDYDDNTASTWNRLFKIPAEAWTEAQSNPNYVFSPTAVGFYEDGMDSNSFMGKQWTRGEMTLDGTVIVLGDLHDQYLFLRCPGMSVAESLASEGKLHCETWPVAYDGRFETIAWTPDGEWTLEISECRGDCDPFMAYTRMDYSFDPDSSIVCPLQDDGAEAGAATGSPTESPTETDETETDVCIPGFLGIATDMPLLKGEPFINEEFNVYIVQQRDGNLVVRRGTPDNIGDVIWAHGARGNATSYFTKLTQDNDLVTYEGSPENEGAVLWEAGIVHDNDNPDGSYFLGIDCNSEMVSLYALDSNDLGSAVSVWDFLPTASSTTTSPSPTPLPTSGPTTSPTSVPTMTPLPTDKCIPGFLGIATGSPLLKDEIYVNEDFDVYITQQGDGNLVIRRGTPENIGDVMWAHGVLGNATSYFTQLKRNSNLLTLEGSPDDGNDMDRQVLWRSATINDMGDYFLGIDCTGDVVSVYAGTADTEDDLIAAVPIWNLTTASS